jgi:hypothetical protein
MMLITFTFAVMRALLFVALLLTFLGWNMSLKPSTGDLWLLFPLYTLQVLFAYLAAYYISVIALDDIEEVVKSGF